MLPNIAENPSQHEAIAKNKNIKNRVAIRTKTSKPNRNIEHCLQFIFIILQLIFEKKITKSSKNE
jgi:hypothetical protein